MAQYSDLIAGLTLGSYGTAVSTPLAGFTRRLNTSAITTYSVNADTDAPSGKSLKVSHTGSNNRTALTIDAIDSDPDRQNIELIALVRQNATAAGSVGGYGGIQTGTSGTSTTNNRGITILAGRDNGTAINRASYYTGSTVDPNVTMTGSAPHYTVGQLQWLRIRMNGLPWLLDTYDANDLRGTARSSYSGSRPDSTGDNRAGIFTFLANCNLDILYLSAGTNGDPAPAPGDTPGGYTVSGTGELQLSGSGSAWQTPYVGGTGSLAFSGTGNVEYVADSYTAGGVGELQFGGSGSAWQTPYAAGTGELQFGGSGNVQSGAALVLLTRFDGSNASSVNSTITDPTSLTPTVFVKARARAISVFGFWRNIVFGLDKANGKRPIIRIDRSTMDTPTQAPLAEHSAAFTYDWVNFFHASSWTSTGSTGYFEYQFDEPFTQDVVYVMFNPMYPQSQSNAYAAAALANHPSVVSPMPTAVAYKAANPTAPTGAIFVTNANTLYPATDPAEEMTGFPLGALPIYGLKLDWGSTLGGTTDGGPKRTLWAAYGQHAQGEGQSSISFYAALDWMLNSASAAAIAFRRNWIVYATFNINGSGIAGGHTRLSYGYGASNTNNAQDFNRVWTNTSPNVPEVAAVRAAIRADTGGTIDALIDWHGNGTGRGQFNIIASSTENVANQERFNELAATVFDMTNAVIQFNAPNGYIIDEANTTLGAKLAYHAEHDQRGLNTKADLELTGVRHMLTLQLADADGMFYTPDGYFASGTGELQFSGAGSAWQAPYAGGTSALAFSGTGNVLPGYTVSGTGSVEFSGSGSAWQTPYVGGAGSLTFSGTGNVTQPGTYTVGGVGSVTFSGIGNVVQGYTASGIGQLQLSGTGSAWQTPYTGGTGAITISGSGRVIIVGQQRYGVVRLPTVAVKTVLRYNVEID